MPFTTLSPNTISMSSAKTANPDVGDSPRKDRASTAVVPPTSSFDPYHSHFFDFSRCRQSNQGGGGPRPVLRRRPPGRRRERRHLAAKARRCRRAAAALACGLSQVVRRRGHGARSNGSVTTRHGECFGLGSVRGRHGLAPSKNTRRRASAVLSRTFSGPNEYLL